MVKKPVQWRLGTLLLVILVITDNIEGFFETQPKIITESGNLIIESAFDCNITIRIRGHGIFKLNDRSLNSLSDNAGEDHERPAGLTRDLRRLETALHQMEEHFEGNNSIAVRIQRLETQGPRTGAPNQMMRIRNLSNRLARLEQTLITLTTRFDTDHCASNPCQNGGSCRNELGTFRCVCPDNFEGTTCTIDRNECADFAGTDLGCQNGATCENTYGSYRCACSFGWSGVTCKRRSVECLAGPAGELCGHGTCVQTNDARGFTCVCEQGWKTDGVSPACTVDVDECADQRPHCSMDPPVRCVNLPGTYTCGQCPAGYEGNGHYCRDVDECATDNGGCSTAPMVRCVNERGSHRCSACPTGWQGDGRVCTRSTGIAGDPVVCPPGLCHPLATCRTGRLMLPTCICPLGMVGMGIGPYGCRQNPFSDPCATRPCMNGGTCTANNGTTGYRCLCPVGFGWPDCMTDLRNPCASNPCKNEGICTSIDSVLGRSNLFSCRCPATHTGSTCETEVRTCGAVLRTRTGVLRYPVVAGAQYVHNERCAWIIQTEAVQVLNVTFTKFNVEPSSECRHDWLQIHDGPSSAAYMIGRFCGADLPKGGNFVTTHNSMYLWFLSDNSTAHDGFELEWNTIDPVCGGLQYVTSSGTISSPGSPGNYPQNRDCQWTLTATTGKRIELHFFAMQLESHDTCDMDFVAVYDGTSTDGKLLARYCNTTRPEPLTSSGNELLVHFHSDGTGTDTGFQIHYSLAEGVPGCGGTWTANRGEIASPKVDGGYGRNLQCEFLIRMPENSRIKVTFIEFDLESHSECIYDAVSIYEGASTQDPLVGRFCGSEMPGEFVSQTNVIRIDMQTDWSNQGAGFRLRYEVVCGGRYANEEGVIMSPMYPIRYERSSHCRYEITAPPGKAIVLDFIDFDLEDTDSECGFDYLLIEDGFTTSEDTHRRYCGTTRPPQIVSRLNELTLVLHTDSSIQGRGFKANYTTINSTCGGVIKTLGHVIRPELHEDNQYKRNEHCEWTIQAPPKHVVQLTFTSFDLEDSSECFFDSVVVQEITGSLKTRMGKFCGTNIPAVQRTMGNMMSVEFSTDSSLQSDGFAATYEFLPERNFCGGRLLASSGTLTSPGWPANYPADKDCTWIMEAPLHQQIELSVDEFMLERQHNCELDYVEFRNGGTESAPLIGRWCSGAIPKTIRSFTNKLHIRFRTDSSISAKGFKFNWMHTMTGCGGQMTGLTEGAITSPNYPEEYNENGYCEWRISASRGSKIRLWFTDMNMDEGIINCYFDSVEVYDGRSAGSVQLGRFCGTTIPPTLNSTSNEVFIRFKADSSNQGRGFELRFETVCVQRLTDLHGVIQSPGYPHPYPNFLRCRWTIVAPRGNRIQLVFSEFRLETYRRSGTCPFDSLAIEQIDQQNTTVQTTTHCGGVPAPMTSFTDTVALSFHTDFSGRAPGFSLEYTVIGCGQLMRTATGSLHSPNYPAAYPANTECHWTIEVPYGNLVELVLQDFDFPLSVNCTMAGVRIAPDSASPSNVCGQHGAKDPLAVYTSHSNRLDVRFHSSGEHAGRGFNATYRTVPIRCGGTIVSNRGSFHSPNYPQNYDKDLYCEWLIRSPDFHKVQLVFEDFSLEEDETCFHDFVKLYSGSVVDEHKELATLCGHAATPANIYNSTSNEMLVVMRTDLADQLKGFLGRFWTECGATINVTADGGVITSDMVYRYETRQCNFTFRAPTADDHVVLTALEFFNSHDDCESAIYVNEIAQLCHSDTTPTPFVSVANSLRMDVVHAAHATSDTFRFRMHYSLVSAGCGQQLAAKQGEIAAPGFPRSYPLNIECVWTIEASRGNRIQLSFGRAVDIDESEHCNEAYLEVRDTSQQGTILGTFCGTQTPAALVANKFWLKFHSGDKGTGMGFLASYTYVPLVESTGEMGEIQSPLYPAYDIRTERQQYRIMAPLGSVIAVKIQHFLNRAGATLKFYDGFDDQSTEIASYSAEPGSQTPPVVSSTNAMLIVWSAPNEALFRLTWSAHGIDELPSVLGNGTLAPTETLNCTSNSLLRLELGRDINITSPGYPFGYDTNLDCHWTLAPARDGYHVAVFFENVDLEDTFSCAADAVSVATGTDLAGPFAKVQQFCTAQSNVSIHSAIHGTPYLKLSFKSDYYTNRTGFAAVARVHCGGSLSGPSGSVTRGMTGPLMAGQTCTWQITVREGRNVRVTVRQLRLTRDPQTQNCNSFLMLRNGLSSVASPYLGNGQYCGVDLPAVSVLDTTGNAATVQFVKGSHTSVEQFTIDYEETGIECGGTLRVRNPTVAGNDTEHTQYVQSPNYPNIPHAFSECVWTVIGPHGQLLRVDFEGTFDLSAGEPCVQELVELRDGASDGAPVIGTFCGQKPSTQHTTSNVVRIRYFTQARLPKNGFRARISVDTCGGSYRDASGTVTSPGYPGTGAIPPRSTCDYRIHAAPGATLNITFLDFDLKENRWYSDVNENCTDVDHVLVYYVTPDAALSLMGAYCTEEKPPAIITQASEVLVRLVTQDKVGNIRGFRLTYNTSTERCGGELVAESGYIMSPGYPFGRASRQYCEWRITVPKGRRVRVDMMDTDLALRLTNSPVGYSPMANLVRLNFYNDLTYASRINSINSSSQSVRTVQSTDNRMLINFWTRSNANHRGFKLNFTSNEMAACTGDFNDAIGHIMSPANLSTFSCTYQRYPSSGQLIDSQPGVGTLALRIATTETANFGSVCNRSIGMVLPIRLQHEARDMFTVKRSCNNGTMATVDTVATPFADVVLTTRQHLWLSSYTIDYRVHQCGGVFRDQASYTVHAPALNTTVLEGEPLSCAWYFGGEAGIRIAVQMEWSGLDCEHDHVNVFNGRYPNSPLVERVCGTDAGRRNFTADISGEQLLIEFHTTRYRSNVTTFRVQIDTNYAQCGGLLSAPNFAFQSPRNSSAGSQQYANNLECVWELRARRGYHVGVSFRNRFFVEQSANCSKDVVQLDELTANNGVRTLARLCGRSVPETVNATGGTMRVTMRTDAQTSGDGFEAVWSENCGGTYEVVVGAEPADIFSPNYPEHYGRNAFCNYTLIGPSEQYINVEFVDFELEDSSRGCIYDNLTVMRSPDWSWNGPATELVGSYCSKGALRTLRYRNRIELIFRSDQWLEHRGFHFRYKIDSCGGAITNTTLIRLPTEADQSDYLPDLRCVWNITAPDNQKIVVRFERIELEPSDYCLQDYIELYEGVELMAENRKAQLCGNLTGHAPVVNINGNRALLRFQSDSSVSKGGFAALVLFVSKCDMTIELNEVERTYELIKVFAEYAKSLDCHYKVVAPEGWVIRMEFSEFHLAECALHTADGCHCDYVQVRDGAGEFAEPIGANRCGHTVPANVTSTHNALWVRFVTDTEISSTGFRARFTIERSTCGVMEITVNETHPQQTLSWPQNGEQMRPNERCQWRFTTEPGSLIVLSFDRLVIPSTNGSECLSYLEVLDNGNLVYLPEGLHSGTVYTGGKSAINQPSFYNNRHFASAPHIYCGNGTLPPDDFVSAENTVLVRLRSDASFKSGDFGFAVTAKVLKACHRNYTSLSGRIVSNTLATCDTYVTVPANYTIALYFARFTLHPNDYTYKCTEANAPLKLMDGSRLARWDCPSVGQMPFFSNTSSVTLRFTDISVMVFTASLYDITYVASDQGRGCGGDIANYGGQISSPMYPATGRMHRDCRWTLTVPQNQVVQLQFEVFDMGPRSTCADNFVQLIEQRTVDGAAVNADAVAVANSTEHTVRTFCGTDRPANFASLSNRVVVRFKSTVNFAGTGWLLNFMAAQPNAIVPEY